MELLNLDTDLWEKAAKNIDWITPPKDVIGNNPANKANPHVWFPGGTLNTCYNAVDRHAALHPDRVALYWDSAMEPIKMKYTYAQLLEQVQTLAGVLVSYGVTKGDTVLIYMPMVPEAVFSLLACARIGAIHSVVFGNIIVIIIIIRFINKFLTFIYRWVRP